MYTALLPMLDFWVLITYFLFVVVIVFLLVQQPNNRVLALYSYTALDHSELHLIKVGSIMSGVAL